MKIGAVINNSSGTLSPEESGNRLREIKQHLEPRVSPGCLSIVPGSQVEQEIIRLKTLDIDVLVVGGGDGTISTAARLVSNTEIALAALGLGTRNHFVRDLGIPLDPIEAIGLLDRLHVQHIDLGEVNGHAFINNASLGLYPKIVKERDKKMQTRGWRKWRAEIAAVIAVLRQIPQMRLTVEENEIRTGFLTPFLFVGNNEYQGGILPDPKRSSLQGGKLWLCMACAPGLKPLLRMAWQLRTGSIQSSEDIEARLMAVITLYFMRRKITVAIDGENCKMDTPLRFKILRESLRVVVP